MPAKGFSDHDHKRCIATALQKAEDTCARTGAQMTPVRRRTLEILLQEHRAMGAYQVLDKLREDGLGSQPPVAYRALDFLVKHGFAHRVERLNAFVACTHPTQNHNPAFLICRACGSVEEAMTSTALGGLHGTAKAAGFAIEQAVVEAEGLCPKCGDTA